MKEVKISFNNKLWSSSGTTYRGCFAINEELFHAFKKYVDDYLKKYENQYRFSSEEMNDKMYLPGLNIELEPFSGKKCAFMTLTQTRKFITFLKETGIKFNIDRAFGEFNYYLQIK
jgi:hypothetical protein